MQGTDVGLLARQLFDNGVDATPTDVFHYRESVRDTAKYIAEGHTVIFEAAFQYEGILCAVDILIKHKGKWYAYEVKSSTGVKSAFIQDASLQHFVITQSGLALEDFFIIHINTNYVRQGDLQLRELFAKQSVKQQAQGFQQFVLLNCSAASWETGSRRRRAPSSTKPGRPPRGSFPWSTGPATCRGITCGGWKAVAATSSTRASRDFTP